MRRDPLLPNLPIIKAVDTPTDDETPEVEGHAMRGKPMVERPTDDEREPEDQGEVERHAMRGKGMVEQRDADEHDSQQPEVEGHAVKARVVYEPATDERDREQAEVEGHSVRGRGMVEQPTGDESEADDVEGHGERFNG